MMNANIFYNFVAFAYLSAFASVALFVAYVVVEIIVDDIRLKTESINLDRALYGYREKNKKGRKK